jgi:hypothetical protein
MLLVLGLFVAAHYDPGAFRQVENVLTLLLDARDQRWLSAAPTPPGTAFFARLLDFPVYCSVIGALADPRSIDFHMEGQRSPPLSGLVRPGNRPRPGSPWGLLGGNTMVDTEVGSWLTYAEAAALLGCTPEAVRQRARRHEWSRRTPNAYGGQAQILVPDDADVRPRPAPPPYIRGTADRADGKSTANWWFSARRS